MPYASQAQRGWAHTSAGAKALGGKSAVHEWDNASRGKKLPKFAAKVQKAAGIKTENPKTVADLC